MTEAAKKYPERWRTRDGRKIAVSDMDEDHVRATLNMLIRNRRVRAMLKRDLQALEQWIDGSINDDTRYGKS